ncbi:MAG TPA: hypothetical protein DEP72_01465 [Clostridiales bacterium]|nr:MAG: hypothetical protein A2Y18_05195 [Clostridiales bacterium GWD2_32_19]HCC06822.1 hypothetical protein [Clostridiales bacterium]
MEEKLEFDVRMNVVTHLGKKLYDNLSAALAELVANSWDAYAKEVRIDFTEDKIVIKDTGIGMDYQSLKSYYAPIGQEKKVNEIKIPEDLSPRPVMGKKGIGKLAAFSIGNTYTVYTKSKDDLRIRKFTLNYNEMVNNTGNYQVEVDDITNLCEYLTDEESGFVIEITNLHKAIDERTKTPLVRRLGRRFNIKSEAYDFKIYINNDEISLIDHDFYEDIEYLWTYGENDDANLKEIFKNCNSFEKRDGIINEHGVKIDGWIGTFDVAGKAKNADGDNLNVITIMFNNKVADENILRKINRGELATKYVTGVINAGFLKELDDPITSSRQGIDDSSPEIKDLIDYIDNELKEISTKWGNMRTEQKVNSIKTKYPKVGVWINHKSRKPDTRKVIDKLFKQIGKIDFNDDKQEKLIIRNSILAFENYQIIEELCEFEKVLDNNENGIEEIVKQFNKLSLLEATKYKEILSNRLDVVNQLNKGVAENVLEAVMQKLLYENLWLIDPTWNGSTDISSCEAKLKNEFNEKDPDLKEKRIDILFRKPSESDVPVIIELKRPNAGSYTPTKGKILDQVDNYRRSAALYYNNVKGTTLKPNEVPVIIIWEKNDKVSHLNPEEIKEFEKNNNLLIYTYSRIAENTSVIYSEYIKESKDINENLGFLFQDSWGELEDVIKI